MLLNRTLICERLGGCTWKTALKRLEVLGLEPRKLGRECYIVEADLEMAISGKKRQAPEEPDFSVLERLPKRGRPPKKMLN
ncbi:hypothetical protein [Acidithiobacillus ferriphilus]|uniref:hypothetical protein n=1 Tax=Acidithiobacillus ferriphilus TaxID=1689834 RepID=UPI001C07E9CB|nr:hypothetical protein [Acidithiobacillus ferriphilus]MBU2852961.1 hypothetical protein [Acidithiobacillus ferriphilus]